MSGRTYNRVRNPKRSKGRGLPQSGSFSKPKSMGRPNLKRERALVPARGSHGIMKCAIAGVVAAMVILMGIFPFHHLIAVEAARKVGNLRPLLETKQDHGYDGNGNDGNGATIKGDATSGSVVRGKTVEDQDKVFVNKVFVKNSAKMDDDLTEEANGLVGHEYTNNIGAHQDMADAGTSNSSNEEAHPGMSPILEEYGLVVLGVDSQTRHLVLSSGKKIYEANNRNKCFDMYYTDYNIYTNDCRDNNYEYQMFSYDSGQSILLHL